MPALNRRRARWRFVAACVVSWVAQSCGGDVVIGQNQEMQRESTPDAPAQSFTPSPAPPSPGAEPETPIAMGIGEPPARGDGDDPDDWRPPWDDDDGSDDGRPPPAPEQGGEDFEPEGAPSVFIDRGDRGLDDLAGPVASFPGGVGTNEPMNGPPGEEFFSPEPEFGGEIPDAGFR